MVPNKVIHLHEARRRVARAKKKTAKSPRRPGQGIGQRISDWLTSRTTKGTVLLAGVVAGLIMGAVVASAVTAQKGDPNAEWSLRYQPTAQQQSESRLIP